MENLKIGLESSRAAHLLDAIKRTMQSAMVEQNGAEVQGEISCLDRTPPFNRVSTVVSDWPCVCRSGWMGPAAIRSLTATEDSQRIPNSAPTGCPSFLPVITQVTILLISDTCQSSVHMCTCGAARITVKAQSSYRWPT